jgi:hypothetical protein
MTESVTIGTLRERVDRTRSGEDFMKASAVPATTGGKREGNAKPYLVARRKTREHGVLVLAASAREAQLLARADKVIAALGTDISAFALSGLKIEQALRGGAKDLRSGS